MSIILKVYSYNILEDILSNPDFFINSNNKHLDKCNRIKKLLNILINEINDKKQINIFCLQEVGTDVQLSILYEFFYRFNYNVIFVGDLLIGYPNNLKLLSCESGNISKLTKHSSFNFNHYQINLIKSKKKYFIILKLKDNITNKEFVVCTCHLISFNDDLKLLQLLLILNVLDKHDNVIFSGDFNIESHNKILQLVLTGNIKDQHGVYHLQKKYNNIYNINNNLITTHTSNKITPIYTEMLDYIFVSTNIKVLDCLKLKNKNDVKNDVYWPNDKQPSDHQMIWGLIE